MHRHKGRLVPELCRYCKEILWVQYLHSGPKKPTRSDGDNILGMVNKYMDLYLENTENLANKAKAEKYAKITAKTIISSGGGDSSSYGQNAFFYGRSGGTAYQCNPADC